jgi:hypothetical protein
MSNCEPYHRTCDWMSILPPAENERQEWLGGTGNLRLSDACRRRDSSTV